MTTADLKGDTARGAKAIARAQMKYLERRPYNHRYNEYGAPFMHDPPWCKDVAETAHFETFGVRDKFPHVRSRLVTSPPIFGITPEYRKFLINYPEDTTHFWVSDLHGPGGILRAYRAGYLPNERVSEHMVMHGASATILQKFLIAVKQKWVTVERDKPRSVHRIKSKSSTIVVVQECPR
jgi:hypothetical protein